MPLAVATVSQCKIFSNNCKIDLKLCKIDLLAQFYFTNEDRTLKANISKAISPRKKHHFSVNEPFHKALNIINFHYNFPIKYTLGHHLQLGSHHSSYVALAL